MTDCAEVAMEEVCHFDRLPNEILQLIFKHLLNLKIADDSNRKSKLIEATVTKKQSDLNCRLVNSRWKSGMEPELEKNALSLWRKMSIPVSHRDLEAEPPHLGYLFVKKEENKLLPGKMVFLSRPLESGGENGNPFQSGSLKITSKLGKTRPPSPSSTKRNVDYQPQLIELVPFFTKFGHHLTSLIFQSVTLTQKTLIRILDNTPKLKALNLIRVAFWTNISNCSQLPALQDLQHIRLVQLKELADKELGVVLWYALDGEFHLLRENDNHKEDDKDKEQLYNWILSPYKKQLLTLDIFAGGIGTPSNFANLERLFISHADETNFLQPNVILYPRLKSLFLTDVQIKFKEDRMEWLKRNIGPFAETLSELYLDLPRRIRGQLLEAGPLFQVNPKSAHKKTKKVVFPEMKTLAIPFPLFPEEVQVIMEVIMGFPNLEVLMFLVRGWEYEVPEEEAQKFTKLEEFGKVCPKLKKVWICRL